MTMRNKFHIFIKSIDRRPLCGNRSIDRRVSGIFVDVSIYPNNPALFFKESWKCIKKNYRYQNCENIFESKNKV